jgi:hypothetical protein
MNPAAISHLPPAKQAAVLALFARLKDAAALRRAENPVQIFPSSRPPKAAAPAATPPGKP